MIKQLLLLVSFICFVVAAIQPNNQPSYNRAIAVGLAALIAALYFV